MLMARSSVSRLKALWAAKKEDIYAVAVMAGVPLFMIVAAPYCC